MSTKTPNHELSALRCPVNLEDVDLFSPGAQEHWYEAYPILHREAPVLRVPGEGLTPGTDGFILTISTDALLASGVPPEEAPQTNAMLASMATLRPNDELYRAHRQELTDPWVGPGASRHTDMVTRYVRYGSSPRGAQALILGAKISALLDGRYNVAFDDVKAVAPASLRHRLLLNFEGQAEGITTDAVIAQLLDTVPAG